MGQAGEVGHGISTALPFDWKTFYLDPCQFPLVCLIFEQDEGPVFVQLSLPFGLPANNNINKLQ